MKRRITTGEILENQIDQILREQKKEENFKNKTPKVGPRLKYIHYIYDMKMKHIDAMKKILEEYPQISYTEVVKWYDEEEKRRERGNSDEGR